MGPVYDADKDRRPIAMGASLPTCNRLQSGRPKDQVRPAQSAPWLPMKIRRRNPDAETAKLFRLSFGQHKGKALGTILKKPGGREYLEWLATLDWVCGLTRINLEALLVSLPPQQGQPTKQKVLPKPKPEHALVAPWEDHPCNMME